MYAPPAADGPNRQHTCGTLPESRTWLAKMRPAPRRPGNSSTWSVMRAPAESTRYTTGSSCRSACSVSRTIFSTVRAPHEPAFTVESFAITHTGRPSMRPTPVTTPSAGRSPASALASSPSSTNESSSSSSASRSRTNSLFWRASFSAFLGEVALRAPGRCARRPLDRRGPSRRLTSYRRGRGPACSSALGSSRPTISCARRRARRAARRDRCRSRSPCRRSMCTRSSVTALPDAPGAYGTAAQPADRRVEARHAPLERRRRRSRARCRACCGSAGRRDRR